MVFNVVQTLKFVHKYQDSFISVIFDTFQIMITVIQPPVTKAGFFQDPFCSLQQDQGRAFKKVGPEHLWFNANLVDILGVFA